MVETVRYRVVEKTFVNGVMHEKGAIIEAAGGLEGAALKLIEPSAPGSVPSVPPPLAEGPLKTELELEKAGRKADAEAASAEVANLTRQIIDHLASRDQMVADLGKATRDLAILAGEVEAERTGRKADLETAAAQIAELRQQLEAAQAARPGKR